MAAKLLHSLADENPDLQKQIGCMTGIFQLFDRPNVLTGRRLNHKRIPLPSGDSHSGNGHYQGESFNANYRQDVGSNKGLNEKQRFSTESSRVSYSSSCSSPSSSFDCSKISQPEVSSFDRNISHETPLRDPTINQIKASPHFGRQFVDLRDVVKDSMNRELKGLSLHVKSKDEAVTRGVKNSNSPSTLNSSVEESYEVRPDGKPNVPSGLKESLRALAKFREAPWYNNEAREITKLSYEAKDPPRFSYDGREANPLSFDSRDTTSKFVPKVKELPRLSLDSRERSIRGSNLQDGKLFNARYSETWKRPPSVVAKLMGLEALPESTCDNHMAPTKADSRSLKMNEFNRQIRIPKSPRNSMRDPTSPRWKNSDVVMKPTSSSRIPIEPAPWKQLEKRQISQSKLVKPVLVPQTTLPNSFPSVYSEIEKRLKDLEFKQSGKDLRALKQILEAMQAKGLLENRKEEQGSKCTSPSQSHEVSSITKEGDSFGKYESPIVIMKPAKLMKKSGISSSLAISVDRSTSLDRLPNVSSADGKKNPATNRTANDKSLRNFRSEKKPSSLNVKPTQSLARAQQLPKENYSSSLKSTGSVSPRLQQKKVELEKRSRPPTASSDANKPVRQSNSNKQLIESTSPGRKLRYKSLNSQLGDDELSQISNWSRCSRHQEDDVPLSHLFVNVISESERDLVVRSSENSTEIGSQSPSITAGKHLILTSRLEHDGLLAELPAVGLEHPSPVSVLDTSLYKDDELSPVKQSSNSPKVNLIQNFEERSSKVHWSPVDDCVPSTTETSCKKLQNVENLMRKLKRLNSNHDEARTDYIASLCENSNPNPDHRYISEILLASGLLLRDLGSGLSTFQLHPSGHPINPELFFVLEQTQSSCLLNVSQTKLGTEKFHRKLIFDAVNEILVKKSTLIGISPEPWLTSEKLAKKTLSAKKLLKELCMEIEELQSSKSHCCIEEKDGLKSILQEDVMYRSEDWLDFNGDIPVAVLDIERLIFKDLVDEIVRGERDSLPTKPSSRRKLFVK